MRKIASSVLVSAALIVIVAAPATAQQRTAAEEADHVKTLIEEAKTRLAQSGQTPSPAQAGTTTGPKIALTADEAVARALERNVTLASQRLTPQTFDYALAATYAFYRPNLNSNVSTSSATTLARQTIEGGVRTNSDTTIWNAGVSQNTKWQGGSYQVNWQNNRIASNQNNNIYNPAYSAGFQAVYVQPILANRKIDQTRTNLLTTEIQQDVAELDLRATTASTVADVRNAYYELVFAILNLENQRASLDLSSKLVQDNRARVEIGTMAPIDIVQAQAEEATRRQNLVNAEAILQNTELNLKRLIVSGTDDPLWTASIDATDRPAPGEEAIDLEAAVRNALANRTDLLSAKKNIDAANVTAAQPGQSDAAVDEPPGHLPSRWPGRHDDAYAKAPRLPRQLTGGTRLAASATGKRRPGRCRCCSLTRSARARRKPTRHDSRSSFVRTRRPSRPPSCRSRLM